MRVLICRFDSSEDINDLSKLLGVKLSESILEYDLDNKTSLKNKSNKLTPVKPEIDKHGCNQHYVGMPEYKSKKIKAYHKILFHSDKSNEILSGLFDQKITDKTQSIWFPKLVHGKNSTYRVMGGLSNNKYPIYVVSKARYENCYTSRFLSQMEVKHFVVVEPHEVEDYRNHAENDFCTVLSLDLAFKDSYDVFSKIGADNGTGPGAARNFCWHHSKQNGHLWHWVMDDNTDEGFHWLYQNSKIKCRSGAFFTAIEDFADRYENLAIVGLNYTKFCKEIDKTPPFVLNTRIYSFLLIRNDIPYFWRGRYNEDTDLSLRVLKDGWCTAQFNSFLAGKATTQRKKGGNTAEFYTKEGTLNKSQMLKDMHPDVTEVVWKFNRWHHTVDYTSFTQRLKLKKGVELPQGVDNYGMKVVATTETTTDDTKTYLENKYNGSEHLILNEYDEYDEDKVKEVVSEIKPLF